MKAQRYLLETDDLGHLAIQPELPARSKIEAIFLVLDEDAKKSMRMPPKELASMTQICGDIMAPAIDEEEWGALK
jgi:hypothetical protein